MILRTVNNAKNAETEKRARESGIELLRLFAILGVIFIHFSDQALRVLNHAAAEENLHIVLILRSFFSSSVDIFLIISGYFICKSYNRTIGKPFDLIWQVCIYQGGFYILMIFMGREPFGIFHIFAAAVPDCYFATLFVVLYLISPYINRLLNSLNQKELKRFIVISLILFSVCSTLSTFFGEVSNKEWMGLNSIGAWSSQQGFNIVNFMLCYCIGAFIRLYKIPSQILKSSKLSLMLIISTIVIIVWAEINQFLPRYGMRSAWVYDNPLVILQAAILFLLAQKIELKSRIINAMAKAVFPTFVIHCLMIWYYDIESLTLSPWFIFLGGYLLFAVASFIVSFLVYYIYRWLNNSLIKRLDRIEISYFEQNNDKNK